MKKIFIVILTSFTSLFLNSCSKSDVMLSGDWWTIIPDEVGSGDENVVIAAFAEEGVTYDNIEVDENKNITNATLLCLQSRCSSQLSYIPICVCKYRYFYLYSQK